MTIPEVEDLFEYWRRQPPVHILVAAYLQFKPPDDPNMPPPEDWVLPAGGGDTPPMTEAPVGPIHGPASGPIFPTR